VVRKLRERGFDLPHIVFSTAYDQYAVEAFRLDASDYLLKPIDKARLAETIARVAKAVQSEMDWDEAAQEAVRPLPLPPGGANCWCATDNAM